MSAPIEWTMSTHVSFAREHIASRQAQYRGVEVASCCLTPQSRRGDFGESVMSYSITDRRYPNLRDVAYRDESEMRAAIDCVLPRVTT